MSLKGSCLCKKVKYEITGELNDVLNCHCSMCRKLHASALELEPKLQRKIGIRFQVQST